MRTDFFRAERMESFLHYLTPVAMGLVVLVLLAGLVNMTRGGSANTSQMLMRWRVILQFVAVVVMMGALYLHSQ
ncbi:hypothetical protein BH10PSE9_BH10PSE9_22410 [soil metagenome]